jgi:hypothetical protein
MSDPVAGLRALCLALPGAHERISHGSPSWFAGKGKCFASLDDHHHGAPHLAVWLPLPEGMQALLLAEAPDWFFRPPYVGHKGWVGMRLDVDPDPKQVAALVRMAFLHVAGVRLRRLAEATGAENSS